ncbi:MAG: hypothetical protein WBG46_01965 [Nonlabens sp.]
MPLKTNKYLLLALVIALIFHGSAIFFTLESTYDALIHLFFADHYATDWFSHWNMKWYTGFTVMGYPPLVHQTIAAFSFLGGLKFGLFATAIVAVILFITGIYRFSLLITSNLQMAGYAALFAVFSSSFVETLHLFGQLPSIIGIGLLLHALPEIHGWIKDRSWKRLWTAIALIGVTVCSHHVTPIFGMIFFIFPVIGMAIMDRAISDLAFAKAELSNANLSKKNQKVSKENSTSGSPKKLKLEPKDSNLHGEKITLKAFWNTFRKLFWRIVGFGMASLVLIVGCILPYWINTKNNPITQVPIPHGSRDNFLEVLSSGLVFFIIPWGVLLFILPYIFYRFFSKRLLFFGLSFSLLTLLGTGGTTPLPKLLLGDNAFNILTLDRFTLWASIMAVPIAGSFIYELVQGSMHRYILERLGKVANRVILSFFAVTFIVFTIFTISLGYFRPSQPAKIDMQPITNFLNQDQHDRWRYLTLGFGDQMAWLATQTKAQSVDGNYHSARRLPELTTRPVERLENSKFRGIEGLGSLQQFLTVPEKYHLKYTFSNDKFYDPILYFCGWQRLQRLENGIMVWERLNVSPLPSISSRDQVPLWQNILWGTVPMSMVVILLFVVFRRVTNLYRAEYDESIALWKSKKKRSSSFKTLFFGGSTIWVAVVCVAFVHQMYAVYIQNDSYRSPENVLLSYYDATDFKRYQDAFDHFAANESLSFDRFMLSISVTDGLTSSYAKLQNIETEIIEQNEFTARAKVHLAYVTPLKKIFKEEEHDLIKEDGKWKIRYKDLGTDLPPDQLVSINSTTFFNQGRRRISTEQTYHEDVLKQPNLQILDAKLVQQNGSYFIIGTVQNIDTVPADVIINGTLYDEENKQLASYNAQYELKHKLLPMEQSPFKIGFQGIAWSTTKDEIPSVYDPDHYTPLFFENAPTKFAIQAAGNVSTEDLDEPLTISDLNLQSKQLTGSLFNTGIQEVTIPQMLTSYYNENQELIWLDNYFVSESVRPYRKQKFEVTLQDLKGLKVIDQDMSNCYVNGMPNKILSTPQTKTLQKTDMQSIPYVSLMTNSYISKPTQ